PVDQTTGRRATYRPGQDATGPAALAAEPRPGRCPGRVGPGRASGGRAAGVRPALGQRGGAAQAGGGGSEIAMPSEGHEPGGKGGRERPGPSAHPFGQLVGRYPATKLADEATTVPCTRRKAPVPQQLKSTSPAAVWALPRHNRGTCRAGAGRPASSP